MYAMPYTSPSCSLATVFTRGSVRRKEFNDPVVVLHAAGLLHALLHALQAGGARPGDKSLRSITGLRDRLDPALGELGLLLLPQRLQVPQAGDLVLDRGALQDLAGLWRERLPLLLVDQDHEVGLEEVGQDAVPDVAVPVQVHQADLGPRREVDRAALERGVELGRRQVDYLRAEVVGEERVVDRVAAHPEALYVDVPARVELRLLGRPEVEADSAVDPAEQHHAGALLVDLVQEVDAAVLARSRPVDRARADRVALGHRGGVERARAVDHVDHAAAHRAGLLHHPDRLRPAAHLNGEYPLTRLARLLHELEEAARVDERGREYVRGAESVGRNAGGCSTGERQRGDQTTCVQGPLLRLSRRRAASYHPASDDGLFRLRAHRSRARREPVPPR